MLWIVQFHDTALAVFEGIERYNSNSLTIRLTTFGHCDPLTFS